MSVLTKVTSRQTPPIRASCAHVSAVSLGLIRKCPTSPPISLVECRQSVLSPDDLLFLVLPPAFTWSATSWVNLGPPSRSVTWSSSVNPLCVTRTGVFGMSARSWSCRNGLRRVARWRIFPSRPRCCDGGKVAPLARHRTHSCLFIPWSVFLCSHSMRIRMNSEFSTNCKRRRG